MNVSSVFLCGWLTGVLTVAVTLHFTHSYHYMAKQAKFECERNLPRDQQCIVTAIPKK